MSRTIAVTFDDLPLQPPIRDMAVIYDLNERILRSLTANNIPATGFVNEKAIASDAETPGRNILEMWLDAGQELGNHTFSHLDLHTASLEEFCANIIEGERLTRKLMQDRGRVLKYFRHPHLHTGTTLEMRSAVEEFLRHRGYTIAPVTVPGDDWMFAQIYDKALRDDEELIMQYVGATYIPYMEASLKYAEETAAALFGREIPLVLLLHASALSANYLDDLIAMMRNRNYSFISLSQALADEAYQTPDTYIGPFGLSWLHRWAGTMGQSLQAKPGEPEALIRLHAVTDFS